MKSLRSSLRGSLGPLIVVVSAALPAFPQIHQDAWIRAHDRTEQRIEHQAVTLPNGKVMVMGRYDVEALDILFGNGTGLRLHSVEVYDSASDQWEAAAPMPQAAGFQWAAVLKTGQVLV